MYLVNSKLIALKYSCLRKLSGLTILAFVSLSLVSCNTPKDTDHVAISPGTALEVSQEPSETLDPESELLSLPSNDKNSASKDQENDASREPSPKSAHASAKTSELEVSSWSKQEDALKLADDAKEAEAQPSSAAPVDLKQKVDAGPNAQMRIKRIEFTEGEAKGIGELAGSAILVEIQITNESDEDLDLSRAQLRLFFGQKREPSALLSDKRSIALPVLLEAGMTVNAVFIFSATESSHGRVSVEFETGATSTIQQLAGEVG